MSLHHDYNLILNLVGELMFRENVIIGISALAVALAVQLFLEATHRADSIGWFYTFISALVYAVPLFVVTRLVTTLIKRKNAVKKR
jgi:hypothetical protein